MTTEQARHQSVDALWTILRKAYAQKGITLERLEYLHPDLESAYRFTIVSIMQQVGIGEHGDLTVSEAVIIVRELEQRNVKLPFRPGVNWNE